MTDNDSKYDKVLEINEHPERYSSEQLHELLSDPELKEIYELLSMTDTSIKATELNPDVEAEWESFVRNHPFRNRGIFSWIGNRAASIAAIAGVSIVAVAAGIAITVTVSNHKSDSASVKEVTFGNASVEAPSHSMATDKDSLAIVSSPIMFEDQSLESIMRSVEEIYGVEVRFNNHETAALHLYYRLNPALTIEEVIAQLNTFEQLNIQLKDNVITID